jgi:hypothetical protein
MPFRSFFAVDADAQPDSRGSTPAMTMRELERRGELGMRSTGQPWVIKPGNDGEKR